MQQEIRARLKHNWFFFFKRILEEVIRENYQPVQKQEKKSNQENYHHIFSSNHLY